MYKNLYYATILINQSTLLSTHFHLTSFIPPTSRSTCTLHRRLFTQERYHSAQSQPSTST